MDLTNFRFEVDADGIALATWDMPGRSMNVITAEVMDELARIVDEVTGNAAIKGCVIASGKDSFSGGADLTMLQGLRARSRRCAASRARRRRCASSSRRSRRLTLLYRRIETCGQALRHRHQRRLHGRRVRTGARLPPPGGRRTTPPPASACPR